MKDSDINLFKRKTKWDIFSLIVALIAARPNRPHNSRGPFTPTGQGRVQYATKATGLVSKHQMPPPEPPPKQDGDLRRVLVESDGRFH